MCLFKYYSFIFLISIFAEEPAPPSLVREAIGEDYINVSFVPGEYHDDEPSPVGNSYYVRYKPEGTADDDWQVRLLFWLFFYDF